MSVIEFEANEIHTARYRIQRDALTEEQWQHFQRLKTNDGKAQYLSGLGVSVQLVDGSVAYSHMDEASARNFAVVGTV